MVADGFALISDRSLDVPLVDRRESSPNSWRICWCKAITRPYREGDACLGTAIVVTGRVRACGGRALRAGRCDGRLAVSIAVGR